MSSKTLNPFLTISEVTMAMNSTLDPDQVLEMILDHLEYLFKLTELIPLRFKGIFFYLAIIVSIKCSKLL